MLAPLGVGVEEAKASEISDLLALTTSAIAAADIQKSRLEVSMASMYAHSMQFSTHESILLLAVQLRATDRDRYILSLFAPTPAREALVVLYALNLELEHVHHVVSEEMIGHIRYAWWDETLTALFDNMPRQGHPLIEAMQPLATEGIIVREDVLSLVTLYRESFPEMPDEQPLLHQLSIELLQKHTPHVLAKWQKAYDTITRHRQKHGSKHQLWLYVKLLV